MHVYCQVCWGIRRLPRGASINQNMIRFTAIQHDQGCNHRWGRFPYRWAGSFWMATFCCLFLFLTSCSKDFVDPFENEERFFTIYGYIDAQQITHKVRVIPVTRHQAIIRHPADIQAALDAEVTLTDVSSGEVVEWVYNLEELSDGTFGHIFTTEYVVTPGRRYRLDVTRSDGVRAWALTEVPYIPDSAFYDLGPIAFSADSSEVSRQIAIPGSPNPWTFEAIYNWSGGAFNRRVFVPYGRRGTEDGAEWVTTMSISADQEAVQETIQESMRAGRIRDDTPLVLTGAGLRMTMLDENWLLPNNELILDVTILPSKTTNINNGYGFFGSIGYYVQEWEACDLSGPLGYEFAEPNCGSRENEDEQVILEEKGDGAWEGH